VVSCGEVIVRWLVHIGHIAAVTTGNDTHETSLANGYKSVSLPQSQLRSARARKEEDSHINTGYKPVVRQLVLPWSLHIASSSQEILGATPQQPSIKGRGALLSRNISRNISCKTRRNQFESVGLISPCNSHHLAIPW
jgi:hypothetical protein